MSHVHLISIDCNDLHSLLYQYLNEFVYLLSGENFIASKVSINEINQIDGVFYLTGEW